MTWEQFEEDFNKTVYVSSSAEFKRNFTAKYSFKVFAEKGEVSNFLRLKFLRNVMDQKVDSMEFIHKFVNVGKAKQPVFISVIEDTPKTSRFAYRYKKGEDFYTVEIRVDKKKHHSLVTLFRTVKWFKTIVGVNGQMGKRNFKKDHKNESIVIENMTTKHFGAK